MFFYLTSDQPILVSGSTKQDPVSPTHFLLRHHPFLIEAALIKSPHMDYYILVTVSAHLSLTVSSFRCSRFWGKKKSSVILIFFLSISEGLTFLRHTNPLLPTVREHRLFLWVSTHHKWPGSVR